jgi:methionyl-tRNA formyltransferase
VNTNNIKFAFFGGEPLAVPTLEKLYKNGFVPTLIVCNPDKPAGRNMILTPPPIKTWAIKNNIPYTQPEKFDTEFTSKLEVSTYNLFIIVAYGKIIPEKIINIPKLGTINIHPSLLPKYRGPSPIVSTILNGDKEAGVSIIKIDAEMDHGPILAQEKIILAGHEMVQDLEKTLGDLGGELLVKLLTPSASGTSPYIGGGWVGVPQDDSQATFCKKIKKEDGLIDLNNDAIKNYNKFRAYAHWPRTFFFKDDKRIIITKARLEDGKFVIEKIIPEGGKEIDYKL